MEETTKKRKGYSTPEAQAEANKRWVEKNKERKQRTNNKSTAKKFILTQITLDELDEFQTYLEDRRKQLEQA